MITRYLSELLYDHDCVIVPELGAFLTKECPASIDYTNHRFTPPCKEIVFNGQLLNDDKILVNYLIEKEGITEDVAKQAIHDFAMQTLATLESGLSVSLNGIGELKLNANHDVVLKSDDDANFLASSFGLTAFTAQPIYRSETYQVIKEKITVQNLEKNTPLSLAVEEVVVTEKPRIKRDYKWLRPISYVSLVCLMFLLLGWGAQKNSSNLAGWIPFFYSSPNEFIISHLVFNDVKTIPIEDINIVEKTEVVAPEVIEPAIAEPEVVTPEVVEPIVVEPIVVEPEVAQIEEAPVINHYFIIGGSFQEQNRAEICLNAMKNKGFDNSLIMDCNEKGYWRVAYEAFADKETALLRLSTIKSDVNEAAWLLFQK